MKNYDKYKDKIRNYKGDSFCSEFVEPYVLKPIGLSCHDLDCVKCSMRQVLWLLEDYEEPETDWSKVEVDTPILVRADEEEAWLKRYFAKYEN